MASLLESSDEAERQKRLPTSAGHSNRRPCCLHLRPMESMQDAPWLISAWVCPLPRALLEAHTNAIQRASWAPSANTQHTPARARRSVHQTANTRTMLTRMPTHLDSRGESLKRLSEDFVVANAKSFLARLSLSGSHPSYRLYNFNPQACFVWCSLCPACASRSDSAIARPMHRSQ